MDTLLQIRAYSYHASLALHRDRPSSAGRGGRALRRGASRCPSSAAITAVTEIDPESDRREAAEPAPHDRQRGSELRLADASGARGSRRCARGRRAGRRGAARCAGSGSARRARRAARARVVPCEQARAAVGVARERCRAGSRRPGTASTGPVQRPPVAVGLDVRGPRTRRRRCRRRPASTATRTSRRRPSRSISVSRVRAKRVCSARSSGTCANCGASAAAATRPAAVERHGHARVAVEQAAAVVDRARVADEGVATRRNRVRLNVTCT